MTVDLSRLPERTKHHFRFATKQQAQHAPLNPRDRGCIAARKPQQRIAHPKRQPAPFLSHRQLCHSQCLVSSLREKQCNIRPRAQRGATVLGRIPRDRPFAFLSVRKTSNRSPRLADKRLSSDRMVFAWLRGYIPTSRTKERHSPITDTDLAVATLSIEV
jgi:hypothetical protein